MALLVLQTRLAEVVALMFPFFFLADFPSRLSTDCTDTKDHSKERTAVEGVVVKTLQVTIYTLYGGLQRLP